MVAAAALPHHPASVRPCMFTPTPVQLEAIRPAQAPYERAAHFLRREPLLNLRKCPRAVLVTLLPTPIHGRGPSIMVTGVK